MRFADNQGRTWIVSIDVGAIKRVRALASVNLLEVVETDLIGRLSSDPILLCDVIYAVCKPQADRDGVTDEDFGRAMAGDTITLATTALLEGLVMFFPEPQRRLLQTAAAKYKAMETRAMEIVQAKLDEIDTETAIEDLKTALARRNASNASTASPESAESAQTA